MEEQTEHFTCDVIDAELQGMARCTLVTIDRQCKHGTVYCPRIPNGHRNHEGRELVNTYIW